MASENLDDLQSNYDALVEKVGELEADYLNLKKRVSRNNYVQSQRAKSNRLFLFGLSGFAAITIAGFSFQDGQIAWSFNSALLDQVLLFLQVSGFVGSGTMVVAALQKDPNQTPDD